MHTEHVSELLDLLSLEPLEDNLFRGQSRDIGTRFVFGGQVLGQAMSAAQYTVDKSRQVHSLHAYFLRAGDIKAPIVYDVEHVRDGHSFSSRRVNAIQHGQVILNCSLSFQIEEDGIEHQSSMPDVPPPETLEASPLVPNEDLAKLPVKIQRWAHKESPFDFRAVWARNALRPEKHPPHQQIWFRLSKPIDASPMMHRALLAYASDFRLIGTATLPHGLSYISHNVQLASLDHAMWFHRPFRIDEWLLYSYDSPTAQGARGLARGQIFARDGRLVASTAQEGLIRVRD